MDAAGLRRNYFLFELVLTAALLAVPFALFAGFFGPQFLLLLPSWAAGFLVSWKEEGKKDSLIRQLAASAGILGAGVWLVFAMSSATDYGEIALVCVEGIFISSAVLSFFVSSGRSLTLLQYLSLTAFIGHAFFYPQYNGGVIILIGVYAALWLCIFRLKFHALALSPPRLLFRADGALTLALVLAAAGWLSAVLVTSDVAARVINSRQAQKWQETKSKIAAAQRGYFEQVEQFQSKMALRLPELSTQAKRQEGLMALSEVTSGTSSAFESQNAEEGLISLLNNPGPGLAPKMEDEGLTLSTRGFMDQKTKFKQDQSFKDVASQMKQQPFTDRLSSQDALNSLKDAETAQEAAQQEKRLKEKAASARFTEEGRKAAMNGIKGLAEWKTMEIYRRQMNSLSAAFDELTGNSRGQLNAVLASIRGARSLKDIQEARSLLDKASESAQGAQQQLLARAGEALDMKLKLLEYSQTAGLEQGLQQQPGLGVYTRREVETLLGQAMEKTDPREQADALGKLYDKVNGSAPSQVGATKELIDTEAYLGQEKAKAQIAGAIAKSALPDKGKSFMSEVKKSAELSPPKGVKIVEDLERQAKKYQANGFMRSSEFGETLARLEELKSLLELRVRTSVEQETVEETPVEVAPPQPFAPDQLLSIVLTPESLRLTKGQRLSMKAEAVYGDSSRKDVTARALWEVSDSEVLSVSQSGGVEALRKGSASVWASSRGVRSLPAEAIVTLVPVNYAALAVKTFSCLALLALFVLALLVYRQGEARRELAAAGHEPNQSIQAIYANLLRILILLGLGSVGEHSPRSRARDARAGLGIGEDIERLTEHYEEARYSGRPLGRSHADAAMELYSRILVDIWGGLKTSRKAGLFFSGLIKGVPVRPGHLQRPAR